MRLRFIYIGMLTALLNACASLPPATEVGGVNQFDIPPDLTAWSANGKFSFRSPENRESGQFYWTQSDNNYLLRLVGPFGLGTAEVEHSNEGVTIRSRGEIYQGEITEQLLLDLTGITVPLNELSSILLGDGHMTNNQWQVEYGDAMAVDDYLLPQRLTLSSGDQVLQIFISRWSI